MSNAIEALPLSIQRISQSLSLRASVSVHSCLIRPYYIYIYIYNSFVFFLPSSSCRGSLMPSPQHRTSTKLTGKKISLLGIPISALQCMTLDTLNNLARNFIQGNITNKIYLVLKIKYHAYITRQVIIVHSIFILRDLILEMELG